MNNYGFYSQNFFFLPGYQPLLMPVTEVFQPIQILPVEPNILPSPLTAYQIKRIQGSVKTIQEKQIHEIYHLASKLNQQRNELNTPITLVTKKIGESSDSHHNLHEYFTLGNYKIHFFSKGGKNQVSVYISGREKEDGLPKNGIAGSSKVFTRAVRLIFDVEKHTVKISEVARLRIDPRITDLFRWKMIYNDFKREIEFLNRFSSRYDKGVCTVLNSMQYQGSHGKQPRDKIACYEVLCKDGDLVDFSNHLVKHPEEEERLKTNLKNLFESLATGLISLEKRSIIHNDIKIDNIGLSNSWTGIICDFGFAEFTKSIDQAKSYGRTPECLSPERLQYTFEHKFDGDAIGHSSDMWAMGCVFYEMYSSESPLWMSLSKALHNLVMLDQQTQSLIEEFEKKKANGLYRPILMSDNFILQFKLEKNIKDLLVLCEGASRVFSVRDNFPEIMPLPTLRDDCLVSSEDENIHLVELERFTYKFSVILPVISQMMVQGKFSVVKFDETIDQLKNLQSGCRGLSAQVFALISTGWKEWSDQPLSENPFVKIIQMMLAVSPEARIKAENLLEQVVNIPVQADA